MCGSATSITRSANSATPGRIDSHAVPDFNVVGVAHRQPPRDDGTILPVTVRSPRSNEGAHAYDRSRRYPCAHRLELISTGLSKAKRYSIELGTDPVIIYFRREVLECEDQRLFDPIVRAPTAICLFGDPELAGFNTGKHFLHLIANPLNSLTRECRFDISS